MFLTYIEGKISRWINGTAASLRMRATECGHCSVPVDSLNVPKSTCRRFRHFKHFLRSLFEVKKEKRFFEGKQQMRLVRFLYE